MANQQSIANTWLEEYQNIFDKDDSENHRQNVMTISRAPIGCPIGGCDCMVGFSLMLSHYLRDHTNDYEDKCKRRSIWV